MKSPIKDIKERLDKKWSSIVRSKDRYCFYPYCNFVATDAHHFIRRSNQSTRWNTSNGFGLCRGHHNEVHSAGGQIKFRQYLMDLYGKEFVRDLEKLGNKTAHFKEFDLEEIENDLDKLIQSCNIPL